MKHPLLVLFLTLCLVGCTTRVTDFTIISTKNHSINVKESAKGPRVLGEDMAAMILFIPTGAPNVKNAVDRAIENAGPGFDALVDGVVNYYYAYFILGASFGYKVEGTPVRTVDLRSQLQLDGKDVETALNGMNILYHSKLGIPNDEVIERVTVAHHEESE